MLIIQFNRVKMILIELVSYLDRIFKRDLALSWDKAGLQIGNIDSDIKKILVTLNVTGDVVKEAVNVKADLILSHHPLIFTPLETVLGFKAGEREILMLAENRIAVYSAHTNYDLMPEGLNDYAANIIGLENIRVIEEQAGKWYKFSIFVPLEAEEKVREAICRHGGGKWKNYSCCTFNTRGKGTFIPEEGSKPYKGKTGQLNYVDEVRIECIVSESSLNDVIMAAVEAHPYEEAAYDIYRIENKFGDAGIGRLGELKTPESFKDFTERVKDRLKLDGFRWMCGSKIDTRSIRIRKVALICGSGNSLAERLAGIDCDVIVVGEMSYHNALKIAESGKLIIEIGHGSSEKPAASGMYGKLDDFFKKQNIKIQILKASSGCESWRYKIE
jgi:dinuclear metal center YbgI/SA1388 family protein